MNESVNNILETLDASFILLGKDGKPDERYSPRIVTTIRQVKRIGKDGQEFVQLRSKSKDTVNPDMGFHRNRFFSGGSGSSSRENVLFTKSPYIKSRTGKISQIRPISKFVLNAKAMELIKAGATNLLKDSLGNIKKEFLKVIPYIKNGYHTYTKKGDMIKTYGWKPWIVSIKHNLLGFKEVIVKDGDHTYIDSKLQVNS